MKQHHLQHILAEAASYGYELAVFVIGHYPLIEAARSAAVQMNQWTYDKPWKRMNTLVAADFKMLGDRYVYPGDHAGGWETSHLLASSPELVDLSLASRDQQYGILTTRDPAGSTAAFGNEIYEAAVEKTLEAVEQWRQDPDAFRGHGIPLL